MLPLLPLLPLLALADLTALAAEPDPLLRPEDRIAVLQALAAADMTEADLSFEKDVLQADGIRRDQWRLPGIEALLHAPLSVPADAARWSGALSRAAGEPSLALAAFAPLFGGARPATVPSVPCVPDRASNRAWKQLAAPIRAAVCLLVSQSPTEPDLAAGLAPRELETLEALLRPDGEEDWDQSEGPARTRALLAALTPLQLDLGRELERLNVASGVLGAMRELDPALWPASRVDLSLGGRVVQLGSLGEDSFTAAITLDPGGDDRYLATAAAYEIHLDLAGDDLWVGGPNSLGGTLGGFSLLIDAAGNDSYRAAENSLGAGVLGVGILVDRAGDDSYRGTSFTQGAGTWGVGLLLDQAGSDSYDAQAYAQGFAGTHGVGALWEGGGDDVYRAGGTFPDMPTRLPEHTLSLSQGFSIGMRPDAGGGLGMLVDDSGNDAYVADLFAQGCSYWFSRGYLVDRAGNDHYGMYQYGQGSGIHLSVGGLFDLAGNDAYMGGNIVQGSSHDYSVGWLIDRLGDDLYAANSTAQGGSLTNSTTFFLDVAGDDAYLFRLPASRGQGRFDRSRGAIGVFVDGEGTDRYDTVPGDDGVVRPWAYGIALDHPSLLPPPDPQGPLPPMRVLRDPPADPIASTRVPASPEALADLARGDAVDCQTPPSCAEFRAELAKGGPAAFGRLLPALPRDSLSEEYTLHAVLHAMRSPEADLQLHDLLLAHLAGGPTYAAERWAIRWLGELAVDPEGTALALEPFAVDPDPILREAVASAILAWKIAPPLLDRLARDPEVGTRAVAALALGVGGADPLRVAPLLRDPNVLVRFNAAQAMLLLPSDQVRPVLLVAWKAGEASTPAARRLLIELLGRVGGKEAVAVLRAVAASDPDPWAQRKAKMALEDPAPFEWQPR